MEAEAPPAHAEREAPVVTVEASALSRSFRSGEDVIHAVDGVSFTFKIGRA